MRRYNFVDARNQQKYVEDLVATAEKAVSEGNMRQLYDTTKKLARKYSKPERPVKDKKVPLWILKAILTMMEFTQARPRWKMRHSTSKPVNK
ncbi:unnamed protein product [Schistosoma margrebowiei]|uniref:Uncharacterized protein n=1 Tax=Schistosoma margrebowiei TaxID=48269 RepID=A0A183MSQ3_9TREM|nr:unnamed protein product [Schistosoma margrebowiei]